MTAPKSTMRRMILVHGPELPPCPKYAAARATLDRLAELEEGWDSYGGKRIREGAIAQARSLLQQMEDIGRCDVPFISPVGSGCVQMEWELGGDWLDVTFGETSVGLTKAVDTIVVVELQADGPDAAHARGFVLSTVRRFSHDHPTPTPPRGDRA